MEKAIIPLINKGNDQLGPVLSANFLIDKKNLLQETFLPLTALHNWLKYSPGEARNIIGKNKANLFLGSEVLLRQMNDFAAFEAMKNVIPEDHLTQLLNACRDLNKERVELYKIIDKAAEEIKQSENVIPEDHLTQPLNACRDLNKERVL
ncbi:MAG: hypothetical protein LW595_01360 [Rickettsiales bacterium]|nr:hypothetical protein [Rickettsiales bacterium]